MVGKKIIKFIYFLGLVTYFLERKIKKNKKKYNQTRKLVSLNNSYVMKKMKQKPPRKVAILLPHCIQNYSCPHKITSNIENCRECGLCKIGDLLALKRDMGIGIKVATGGTLARKFIKDEKADLIIAVACERDLVTGIYDALPMSVYGVYNKKVNGPCISTDVSIGEIKIVLDKIKLTK